MAKMIILDNPEDKAKSEEQLKIHFKSMGLAFGKIYNSRW